VNCLSVIMGVPSLKIYTPSLKTQTNESLTPAAGSIFGGQLQFLSFLHNGVFKNENTGSTLLDILLTLLVFSLSGIIYPPPTRFRTFDRKTFPIESRSLFRKGNLSEFLGASLMK